MPTLRISLLLCITLVLSLVIASDAKVFDLPHQVSHNRFLKKRAPAPQLIPGGSNANPVIGAGATPPALSDVPTTQSVSTPTTAASTPVASTSSPSSSSSATSTSGGLVGSAVSGLSSTATTTTATTATSSSSSSSSTSSSPPSSTIQTTSSIPQTSQVSPSIIVTPTQVVSGTGTSQSVVFITDTSSASASASATPSSLSSSSAGITHTALTILIVIATSIGGSIIIWTIIRKWKFGKSSSFDDRMQPIDWQPSTNDDGAIPGINRRHSNASSFHSGSGHAHRAPSATAADPIPDHDFTPGPAHLAPVGGYADLARGPSPQPMMQELARGPSFSHQYQSDPYGVPLHHGGYGTGY